MNQSTMDMQAIQANTQFLGTVRLVGAVFSGIAAGILGLTNLPGFAFYYFMYLCATALLLVKVRSCPVTAHVLFEFGSGAQQLFTVLYALSVLLFHS